MVFKSESDPNKKVKTGKRTRTRKKLDFKPEPDPISGLSRVGSGFSRFGYPMQVSDGDPSSNGQTSNSYNEPQIKQSYRKFFGEFANFSQQRKNYQDTSLESRDIPFYVNAKNDCFLQISKNQNKKLVGVKVVTFSVLYSWLTFGRLKTGHHCCLSKKFLKFLDEEFERALKRLSQKHVPKMSTRSEVKRFKAMANYKGFARHDYLDSLIYDEKDLMKESESIESLIEFEKFLGTNFNIFFWWL